MIRKEFEKQEFDVKPPMFTAQECDGMTPHTFGRMTIDRIPAEVALRYMRRTLARLE